MIEAVQKDAQKRGRAPTMREWERKVKTVPGVDNGFYRVRLQRPSVGTVIKEFGTWNAFLEAAGLSTREPCPPIQGETCSRGHRWTPENTIVCRNGQRACRACRNAAVRRRYRENRENPEWVARKQEARRQWERDRLSESPELLEKERTRRREYKLRKRAQLSESPKLAEQERARYREWNRAYYEKKKQDPEWMEQQRARAREYYHRKRAQSTSTGTPSGGTRTRSSTVK